MINFSSNWDSSKKGKRRGDGGVGCSAGEERTGAGKEGSRRGRKEEGGELRSGKGQQERGKRVGCSKSLFILKQLKNDPNIFS